MHSPQNSKISSNSAPTTLLEQILAKLSLRNIPKDENSEIPPEISRATQNSQPKICKTSKDWKTLNSNTTKNSSTVMDGRNWSNSGGRWPNNLPTDLRYRGNQQSAELSESATTTTTLNHEFNLPPLRNVTPIKSSNSYTKVNGFNSRQVSPGGFNHTMKEDRLDFGRPAAMDSNNQYRSVTPQSHQWRDRDRRPFSASKQFPSKGNFSPEIEDFHLPAKQHIKDFAQSRNSDDFHLPPIQFKPRPMTGQNGSLGSRPQTAFYGTHSTDPSPSVSEFVKLFEKNIPESRPQSQSRPYNNRAPNFTNNYDTIQEETTSIQPDDDCPTRIGKIRRTLQQFDQSVPLYERCTTIGGAAELDNRTPEASRSNSFLALGSVEDFTENKNIDRSSLVRVTRFKAAKATKKSSKTRVRDSRQDGPVFGGSKPKPPNRESPHTLNNNNLHETLMRMVETGSAVQPSVLNTWGSVNSQVGSKLRSVFGNENDVENNDNVGDDTQME